MEIIEDFVDEEIAIAKLWIPRTVAEGDRYFPVSFQQRTNECDEEAVSLFWEIVDTVRPNPNSSFPFSAE